MGSVVIAQIRGGGGGLQSRTTRYQGQRAGCTITTLIPGVNACSQEPPGTMGVCSHCTDSMGRQLLQSKICRSPTTVQILTADTTPPPKNQKFGCRGRGSSKPAVP